jgi:hypothetical protein
VGQLSRGARDRRSAADSPVGPGGNCIARSNTRPPGVACQSTGSTRSGRQRPARDVGSTMVPEAGWARCSFARAASGDWIASSTRERTSHKPFCATTVGQNLEVSDLTSTPSPRIRGNLPTRSRSRTGTGGAEGEGGTDASPPATGGLDKIPKPQRSLASEYRLLASRRESAAQRPGVGKHRPACRTRHVSRALWRAMVMPARRIENLPRRGPERSRIGRSKLNTRLR